MNDRRSRREFLKLGALASASLYSTPVISLAQDLIWPDTRAAHEVNNS
jgi:hypothetical protein